MLLLCGTVILVQFKLTLRETLTKTFVYVSCIHTARVYLIIIILIINKRMLVCYECVIQLYCMSMGHTTPAAKHVLHSISMSAKLL